MYKVCDLIGHFVLASIKRLARSLYIYLHNNMLAHGTVTN